MLTVDPVRHVPAISSWLAIAGLLLGASACQPDVPSTPPSSPAASFDATSDREPAVEPGEVLAGKVYVLGVESAFAKAEACSDEAGARHVHLEAGSIGVAAAIQAVRMEMDTVLDADGVRPVTDWADADVGGKLRRYDVRFGPRAYDYEYHRSGGTPVRERIQLADFDWAHDLLTGVLLLRGWRPRPGTTGHFAAVLGRHLWLTEVVFHGPDVVMNADGPTPAVRISGVTRKQHRDPALRETRTFDVWFSDDPDRVPLRAKTQSSFGDIWLEMTEYRRESGRRCRDYDRVIPLPGDAAPPADE